MTNTLNCGELNLALVARASLARSVEGHKTMRWEQVGASCRIDGLPGLTGEFCLDRCREAGKNLRR
jgi:hypothetical protein